MNGCARLIVRLLVLCYRVRIRHDPRTGLDVGAWIDEDLVDIVIAGGGFIAFETPIDEFVKKAEGTGVQIYGCLEALRPTVDELTMRAIAARYWEQGIAGLYLFNYYNMPQEWKRDTLGRLIDRDALARLDKRYEFDKRGRVRSTSQLGFSFQNAIPSTQLPTALQKTVVGPSTLLKVNIADDLEGAKANRTLGECTVGLRLEDMGNGDVIEVSINGAQLPSPGGRGTEGGGSGASTPRMSTDGWTRDDYVRAPSQYPKQITTNTDPGTVIEWTVDTPPLKKGVNEIGVRLAETDENREEELILADMRVWVRYK